PQRTLAAIGLDPDDHIDEVEPQLTPAGDHELDRAPVNERGQQAAVDEAGERRLYPLAIEPRELLPGHLAVGERELAMVRVAGHVADVGDVIGLVGQHQLREFAWGHQPVVDRGVAGVAMRQSMVAQDPDVAKRRDRRLEPLWRRSLARVEVLIVVEKHHAVDLGGLEPGLDEVDAKHRELLELETQRVGVPGAGLPGPVQHDAQRALFSLVEMVDDDAGDLGDALRFSDLPQDVAFDDGPVSLDQHWPNLSMLTWSLAICLASRRLTCREAGRRLSGERFSKRSAGARSLRRAGGACELISLSERWVSRRVRALAATMPLTPAAAGGVRRFGSR